MSINYLAGSIAVVSVSLIAYQTGALNSVDASPLNLNLKNPPQALEQKTPPTPQVTTTMPIKRVPTPSAVKSTPWQRIKYWVGMVVNHLQMSQRDLGKRFSVTHHPKYPAVFYLFKQSIDTDMVRRQHGVQSNNSPLLAFFQGSAVASPGNNDHTLEAILKFNEQEIEQHHNFIQFLFPTQTKSQFCSYAPMLTPTLIKELCADPTFKKNQERALKMMLGHYGLELNTQKQIVIDNSNFEQKKKNFFINNDHNLLRITRILESLTLLDRFDLAHLFYECLKTIREQVKFNINTNQAKFNEAFEYWKGKMQPHQSKL